MNSSKLRTWAFWFSFEFCLFGGGGVSCFEDDFGVEFEERRGWRDERVCGCHGWRCLKVLLKF